MSADKYPSIFSRQMEAIVYIFSILQSLVAFAKLKRQILLCQPEAKSPKDFTDSSLFWVNQEFAVM